MNYTVNQELVFEWDKNSSRRGKRVRVTIEKIGRKWLALSNGWMADKKTLIVDGGAYASPGRCFLSEADCDEERARNAAWGALIKKMPWGVPDGVSAEDIEQAARLLGLKKEEPK